MKKALAAVLLLITVFALTACQTQSPNDTATNDPGVTASHEVTHIGNNVSYSITDLDSFLDNHGLLRDWKTNDGDPLQLEPAIEAISKSDFGFSAYYNISAGGEQMKLFIDSAAEHIRPAIQDYKVFLDSVLATSDQASAPDSGKIKIYLVAGDKVAEICVDKITFADDHEYNPSVT